MSRQFDGIAPRVDESVYVDPTAVVIGDVVLEKDVSIWPLTVVRGDVNSIRISAGSNIQDGSILHVTSPSKANPEGIKLRIGRNVTVGHQCILHGCTIEANSLIGMGATVMDGAVVESKVMVAARSLIPPGKRLESGYLYMGNPAVRKRLLSEDELAHMAQSAIHYVDLKDRYLKDR
ncbi:MAG: gamma carbonic anhydrase family protein [Motiliproteus sp.]